MVEGAIDALATAIGKIHNAEDAVSKCSPTCFNKYECHLILANIQFLLQLCIEKCAHSFYAWITM